MTCRTCGNDASLLIRNTCAACDPGTHERYGRIMEMMGSAERDFEANTGRSSLSDWHRFESFLLGWDRAEELAGLLAMEPSC